MDGRTDRHCSAVGYDNLEAILTPPLNGEGIGTDTTG
jgi:hypothetical protein